MADCAVSGAPTLVHANHCIHRAIKQLAALLVRKLSATAQSQVAWIMRPQDLCSPSWRCCADLYCTTNLQWQQHAQCGFLWACRLTEQAQCLAIFAQSSRPPACKSRCHLGARRRQNSKKLCPQRLLRMWDKATIQEHAVLCVASSCHG